MEALKGSAKKHLRGLAHGLKPLVIIGKQGITTALVSSIDLALADHELIKIKFNDFREEKKDLCGKIEAELACHLVGITGHVAIFYREQSDPKKRKVVVPAKA